MTLPNQIWDEKNRDIQCLKPLQICGPLKRYIGRLDRMEHGNLFSHFVDIGVQLDIVLVLMTKGK